MTKTITQQLKQVIDRLEEEINKDKFCTLVFRIKDGKFDSFEKNFTIRLGDLGIEIID
jgi:hypothetical protein